MRSNGLEATSYVAIADLDPRVADTMLEVFRDAGLAAYVEPCQPVSSLQFEVRGTAAPTDRLFVDEAEIDRAKRLLDEQLPELRKRVDPGEPSDDSGDSDDSDESAADGARDTEDAAWKELVLAYETSSDAPVPPWPVVEDTDDSADSAGSSDTDAADDAPASKPAEKSRRGPGDSEGYVPPPPPPLPRLDPIAKGAWAGLLGGPALLIVYAVAGAYVPSWFVPVGLVAFAGGFLTLVFFRMRGGPPDESDDGAVV